MKRLLCLSALWACLWAVPCFAQIIPSGVGQGCPQSATTPAGITVTTAQFLGPNSTYWVTNQTLTFAASATITLNAPSCAGQVLNVFVCQNGTGGFTPSFAQGAGLTIVGTFPTFTTTANKCGEFSLTYDTASHAYLTGSNAGPL